MKTIKIGLTQQQIDLATKDATNYFNDEMNKEIEELKKKYEKDKIEIEKCFSKKIEKLKNKFKTFDVPIEDKPKTAKKTIKKISDELLTSYFNEGLLIKEIKELTGKTDQSIRQQLAKMKLKMKDRKVK